jgi:16S rRNA (cytosine1402-N4)-methyltransferase
MSAPDHASVMLKEVLADLNAQPDGIYADATYGRGGYTRALLDAVKCTVYAIDRDQEAVDSAKALLAAYRGRLTVLHGRFGDMLSLLRDCGVQHVNGIMLDLGVSSPQIDQPERGFSFRADGPLDMRMGLSGLSAADVVNTADEAELIDIIRNLGEERFARRIAKAIVAARNDSPITRTNTLAKIVRGAVPRAKDGLDPATRTFMALRLHVNDELGELDRALEAAEQLLTTGGRLVVVSFHSLEDRRVKRFLQQRSDDSAGTSRHVPLPETRPAPSFRLLRRRSLTPTPEETDRNPRARSARLRAAERTDNPAWPPNSERIAA